MTNPLWIPITLAPGATAPVYKTDGAAGADLCAYLPGGGVHLVAGEAPVVISTGVSVQLPDGFEAQVRPRSGLSRAGLVVALGTIDRDYTGIIGVIVSVYFGAHVISHGDRIAQLCVAPVARAVWQVVDALDATERADRGFGHTGVK